MNRNKDLNLQLQEYLSEKTLKNRGEATSLNQLNEWISEFMTIYNRRSLSEFEGLSPENMRNIINDFWDYREIIKFGKLESKDFMHIPIFRQIKYLIYILNRDNKIKLTATGALPVKFLSEIYSEGITDEYIEKNGRKIRREAECSTVVLTHLLAKHSGVVSEKKNIMSLTKIGKQLDKNNQALLELIIKTYSKKMNFGYFDRLENDEVSKLGNGFSFILLAKYGLKELSYRFYADKYFTAFPALKENFPNSTLPTENWAYICYERRIFEIFFNNFGFIQRKEVGNYYDGNKDVLIKKTPIFDKLFKIQYKN